MLSQLIVAQHYNSMDNFIAMYEAYAASGENSLKTFFRKYDAPIRPHRHTCVGLGMEVLNCLKGLEGDFPGISDSVMLVSCDESVQDSVSYVQAGAGPQSFVADTEKDHVMVACHLKVGNRTGVMLSDLGYHIANIITVMEDRNYPHTGWFMYTEFTNCRKDYAYELCQHNPNYVEWHVSETRSGEKSDRVALVYVAQSYLSAVTYTEKRNLAWLKKSIVARNSSNQLTAGVSILRKTDKMEVNIFYEKSNAKERSKIDLDTFLDVQNVPEHMARALEQCGKQLRMQHGELVARLCRLATIFDHNEFVAELLEINERIVQLAAGKHYRRR